jgi:methionine-rich copper-binding protein CopC
MNTLIHIVVAGTFLAMTASAQAHGKLVMSNPADGAQLDHPPSGLRLQFNEPVEAAFTKVGLTGPADQSVPLGPTLVDNADRKAVVLSVPALPSGAYRADWTMVGPDGHKVKGTITFKVK